MAERDVVADCSGLDAFRVFKDYADLLRNRTSFNETLLRQCQQPICQALWGYGIPDLSGIGVSVPISHTTTARRSLAKFIIAGRCRLRPLRLSQRSPLYQPTFPLT